MKAKILIISFVTVVSLFCGSQIGEKVARHLEEEKFNDTRVRVSLDLWNKTFYCDVSEDPTTNQDGVYIGSMPYFYVSYTETSRDKSARFLINGKVIKQYHHMRGAGTPHQIMELIDTVNYPIVPGTNYLKFERLNSRGQVISQGGEAQLGIIVPCTNGIKRGFCEQAGPPWMTISDEEWRKNMNF